MSNIELSPQFTDPSDEIRQRLMDETILQKNIAVEKLEAERAALDHKIGALATQLQEHRSDQQQPQPSRFPVTIRSNWTREWDDLYYLRHDQLAPERTLRIETSSIPDALAVALATQRGPIVSYNYSKMLGFARSEDYPKYIITNTPRSDQKIEVEVIEAYGYPVTAHTALSAELCKAALTLTYLNLHKTLYKVIEENPIIASLQLKGDGERDSYEKLLRRFVLENFDARIIHDSAVTVESPSPSRAE